jgi:hypothetical protein
MVVLCALLPNGFPRWHKDLLADVSYTDRHELGNSPHIEILKALSPIELLEEIEK